MKIQINTDDHIAGDAQLVARVEASAAHALERFSGQITRLEIHLGDENGNKPGPHDMRCMMEARLEGRKPSAVTCHAPTVDQAVTGAAHKMRTSLDRTLGRLKDQQR